MKDASPKSKKWWDDELTRQLKHTGGGGGRKTRREEEEEMLEDILREHGHKDPWKDSQRSLQVYPLNGRFNDRRRPDSHHGTQTESNEQAPLPIIVQSPQAFRTAEKDILDLVYKSLASTKSTSAPGPDGIT
ncbi:hypothetical protein EV426DRAFT_709251 [Tirmania nivea]|nr:hypothetical protein EV426DRAFT_709251 [Tirmania nivea]